MTPVEEYKEYIWNTYEAKAVMNWHNLEKSIRAIYQTAFSDKDKLFLISEAVAAVTGRGRA